MTKKPHNGKKTQKAKEGPKSGKIQMTKRQKNPKRSKEAQNQSQNDPNNQKARNDQWPKQAEQYQSCQKSLERPNVVTK